MKRVSGLCFGLTLLLSGCGGGGNSATSAAKQADSLELFKPALEPYFKYQWYLHYTDNIYTQTLGIDPDASVHIMDAWHISRGRDSVVAVIDTSFETAHPDLHQNILSFYNIDQHNSDVSNKSNKSSHGTACAGFIGAPDNHIGILGTAPESQLVLIVQDYADTALTIEAFEYARKHGAKIISNSWGTGNVLPAVAQELQYLKDQNITIFFASGNNGDGLPTHSRNLDLPGVNDESELPSVIGVGATNELNSLASYSNYGKNIDLLAPGGEYTGLLGLDDTGIKGNAVSRYILPGGYTISIDNNYTFSIGTSFACPIAAGVAALMLSANPKLTPDQIREIMIQTADKIDPQSANYDAKGFSLTHAYGKINAAKAVDLAKRF